MGLLDIVGGMLGNRQGGSGGGTSALINIVAGMLANNGQGGAGAAGGALGGLGGLAGLVEQFQRSGLGDVVGSWVGTGQNLPISPDQLGGALGGDLLSKLTQQSGLSQDDLLGQLSQILPQMVDQVTPEGRVPEGGLGDIGAILSRFGQR